MSRWTFSRKLSHTESQLIHARCWIAKETLNNWAHYTKNINSNKLGLTNVNVRFPHRGITTKTANSSAFESNPWNFSRAMTNDNDTRRKKRVCNKEANSRIFWQSKALKPVDEMGHNAHITWYHRLHTHCSRKHRWRHVTTMLTVIHIKNRVTVTASLDVDFCDTRTQSRTDATWFFIWQDYISQNTTY